MKVFLPIMLLLSMTVTVPLTAQELPPDLQAGADMASGEQSERLLELMKNYRAVMEAELEELRGEEADLKGKLDTVNRRIRAHKAWAWITIPLGAAAIGTGVYTFVSANEAYQNYQSAPSNDTEGYRGQAELYDVLTYSLWGGGLALAGAGSISALTTPNREKLAARYSDLLEEIKRLEEHLQ